MGPIGTLRGELSRRCVFSYLCIVISCWMGREMVTEMFVGVLYMVSCCVSKCNGYAYGIYLSNEEFYKQLCIVEDLFIHGFILKWLYFMER